MTSNSLQKLTSWSQLNEYLDKQKEYPCDPKVFKDQCAIRMGGVLVGTDIGDPDPKSFQGARCGLKGHEPTADVPAGHILRARELANWLRAQTKGVPKVKIYKKATLKDFENKRGIMFIQKPTGAGGLDHIDLWDGQRLKQKYAKNSWISACDQVWFWDLWPYIVKPEGGDVKVYSQTNNNSKVLNDPHGSIKTNRPVDVVKENKDGYVRVNMAKLFDEPANVEHYKYGFIESRFIVPPEPPAATTTGVVTARSLHIRKDHNNSSAEVRGLRNGEKVTIKKIWSDGKDTWAQLDNDGWAAIESNGETLIEGVF
jgi:hypothetical protein